MLAALAAIATAPAATGAGRPEGSERVPRITIAFVEGRASVAGLGGAEGVSPGLMSAGLGGEQPPQVYLDIGQGNRIFGSLYPQSLPFVYTAPGRVPARIWSRIVERALEAPSDLVPGLLAATIAAEGGEGVAMRTDPLAGAPALVAANRRGLISRTFGDHALKTEHTPHKQSGVGHGRGEGSRGLLRFLKRHHRPGELLLLRQQVAQRLERGLQRE